MKRANLSVPGVTIALLVIFLVSCGGGPTQLASQTPEQPTIGQLADFLNAEMERLGVDPDRKSNAAQAGNEVFDLSATLVDPDGDGPENPSGIELTWTERLVGDFDQNGEVGMSDLTPIAIHYGANVNYDPADERNGIGWWPAGDPDNGGAVNWRKARVDGDSNGEINLADVTQIALHWGERIDGYKLYQRGQGDEEFSVVPNSADRESEYTVPRIPADSIDQSKPVRYNYTIDFEVGGEYEFKLAKFDSIDGEGGLSEACGYYNEPPVAALTATPVSGDAPLAVQFDASGSYDPDGYYLWYEWDFDGDGVYDQDSGTDPTVTYTYSSPGEYDATVRVRDYPGATDTASVLITVGGSSNEPPVAVLTAYPVSGNAPLTVAFDASGSYDPDGYYLWFEWDFDGDGVYDLDSGTDSTVTYTYSFPGEYNATVRVRDYPGATDTASVLITVGEGSNEPPVAVLTAYPVSGNAPLAVQFDASGSSDPEGGTLQFEWDFDGDGVYDLDGGTEPTTVYTYGTPGYYDATVRVTDPEGATDTASVLITVGYGPQGPVASIVADYFSLYAPVYVRFDASASYDPDGEIVNYAWDFNNDGVVDRDTGAYPKAATIYLDSGVRYITVTVTDNDGNTDTASIGLSIAAGNDRLYIFPDPLDNDWQDAVGYGDFYEPYIVSSVYYNTDLLTEFSMVAYWYEGDTSTSIPVDDLTWVGYPPYNTEWVAPGTFKATEQTIGNVFAYGMTDPVRNSQQVFIRNTATYPY